MTQWLGIVLFCTIMGVDFFFSVNEAQGKRSIHSFITQDKLSFEKLDVECINYLLHDLAEGTD